MPRPDTVIVGAGLAGASIAARLSGTCMVVEQAAQPATEASAQNAGMVRLLVEDPVERRLALRAQALLEALDDDWEDAPSVVTGGLLALVHDPAHLDHGVAHLRLAGVPVDATDRPADLAPALAGTHVARAWWLPTARTADPHALVMGQLARSRATLRCGLTALGMDLRGGRVAGLRTTAGTIEADRVVLATGAWSGRFAAALGLRRPLIPIRRSLLQTAPHPLARPDHPWTWLDDVGLYVRHEAGGWLVSGCDEAVDPVPEHPGSTGDVSEAWREQLAARLLHYMPALSDCQLRGGWTGLRTFAPDRRPILGADPDVPGLVWATGLGGFGLTTHLAVGEAVATWMEGGSVDWLDPADVAPGRSYPRRWPILPTGQLGRSRLVAG